MASYLHRTAQPSTLATFRSWGSSTGAGRIRLAGAKIGIYYTNENELYKFWARFFPMTRIAGIFSLRNPVITPNSLRLKRIHLLLHWKNHSFNT